MKIPNGVTTLVARTVLKTQKHSPTILFAGGLVAGVSSTVAACRATLKVEDVLDEIQANKEKVQIAHEANVPSYTETDYRRDMTLLYIQGSVKLLRLYGPAFVLGVTSIACFTKSHRILTNRNAAVTAAYSATMKAFEQYRGRVRAELGDEKDREFRYGTVEGSEEIVSVEGQKRKKKTKQLASGDGSLYAKEFNSSNIHWDKEPEFNIMFLRGQQNYANQQLQAKGHVYLNDVYRSLGYEDTRIGGVTGWVKDKGDGYVDFGIFSDPNLTQLKQHVMGRHGEILLDFNVGDGETALIWDQI